jgi:DNA repair exonuclease SbcCD ATPase subunit
MRIIKLTSENIKRIKCVYLTPGAYINRISGDNGSGKTSILDAIEWALAGTSKVAAQPVRRGAGKGYIELDLGDIVVTRRFYENGSRNGTLAVESKTSNSRYQSPQALLDGLMGQISFDPLEFLRMKPEKQAEVLRSLVKLDIDVDALDAAYDAEYYRRRDAKKERDALEIRRNSVGVPSGLPEEKINEVALIEELRQASDYNSELEQLKRDREKLTEAIASDDAEVKAKRERAAALIVEAENLEREAILLDDANKKARATMAKWEPLPPLKNAEQLATQITEARTINAGIERRRLREGYDKEIQALDQEIAELSATMDERTETRAKAIREAEFPVPGLAFGDKMVIYEGLPFDQASNADQIRASVAIGMASNPELRVMRIKDGSLLGTKSMNIIAAMSQEHDFQVFIEVVDTSGKVGVYLEDGEVKAVNPEPEPKPIKTKRKKAETAGAR